MHGVQIWRSGNVQSQCGRDLRTGGRLSDLMRPCASGISERSPLGTLPGRSDLNSKGAEGYERISHGVQFAAISPTLSVILFKWTAYRN